MPLTDKEKALITISFTKAALVPDEVAGMFYGRLFEIAPETQTLFKQTDMRTQGRKFMQTLNTVVRSLNRFDELIPYVTALGKRHLDYGVSSDQYQMVGEALIWTLEKRLGTEFTDEVRQAWLNIYSELAEIAKQAYE